MHLLKTFCNFFGFFSILCTFDDIDYNTVLSVVCWCTSVVARVKRSGMLKITYFLLENSTKYLIYLDEKCWNRTGFEAWVGDFNVFLIGIVDNFVPFVPIDVCWRSRTVNHFTLQRHRTTLMDVQIFRSNN